MKRISNKTTKTGTIVIKDVIQLFSDYLYILLKGLVKRGNYHVSRDYDD